MRGSSKLLQMLVNETSLYSSVSYGLAVRWARRDPDAVNQVNDLLKGAGPRPGGDRRADAGDQARRVGTDRPLDHADRGPTQCDLARD